MAKKAAKSSQMSLDDYDFGSEFDFEEFSLEPKPVKTNREAVERIAGGALEGIKDTLKSPSFFREMIRKALPRGYGDMLDIADQSVTTIRGLYNDGAKEVKPALKEVARVVEKMMPAASQYTPKAAENLLKKFVEANKESSHTGVGGGNTTDFAVAAMMADTFRYTAKEESRRESKEDVKGGIQDAINKDRHNDGIGQLDGIRRSVVSMAAYQRRIEFNYQKKSLELQARHYYVSVDSLNEQKRQNVRNTEFLSGILQNTALPDIIKMKTGERFKDMLRTKAMAGLQDGIFGQRNNFVQNIGKALREQVMGSVNSFAGGVRDGASGVEQGSDALGQMKEMGVDKFHLMGNVLGGEGAKLAAGFGATRLGQHLTGGDGDFAKGVRKFGNRLQFGAENASQFANDFSNKSTDAGEYIDGMLPDRMSDGTKRKISGVGGAILNPILDLFRGTIRRANHTDAQIKTNGIADMHGASAFSNQAHKSLVEVIPGYLARIYRELQITRTGDTSIDLPQYDFAKGTFSKTKAVRKAVFNKLFDQGSKDGVKREKDQLLELLDPTGTKLSPKQRTELSKILMNDNLQGRAGYETGKISNYTGEHNFGESRHGKKYAGLFKALSEKSQAQGDGSVENDFASKFRNVGRSAAERKGDIQQLLEVYPREMFEDMKILKPGSNEIDMKQVHQYFGGDNYESSDNLAEGRTRLPAATPVPAQVSGNSASPTRYRPLPGGNSQDLSKLIEILERQNALPLLAEIRDLLLATQSGPQRENEPADSPLDRTVDAIRGAGSAGMRGYRRLHRQAAVRGGRLMQQHETTLNAAKAKANQIYGQAVGGARRLSRITQVKAGRLLQQQRSAMSGIGGRAQELGENRPNVDELRETLNEHLNSLGDRTSEAAPAARTGILGAAARLFQGGQNDRSKAQSSGEYHSALVEIKDVLIQIKKRLDDGILTMNMPEDPTRLQRLKQSMQGMGNSVKRGVSRLNLRLTDIAKGVFTVGAGTARLGAKIIGSVGGGVLNAAWGLGKGAANMAGGLTSYTAGSAYRGIRGFSDIYVGAERKPRLYGRILQEGNVYFDKATNKPIRRLKDITGTVVKRTSAGEEVVLEENEIAAAYQRLGTFRKSLRELGVTVKAGVGAVQSILGAVSRGIPPVFKAAFWVAKQAWGLLDMAQDIFVKGKLDGPAMTARIMRAKGYHSAVTGKIISRPSQIDGPVLSGDETVLTHDDIRKGLVDKNNKPIRTGLAKLLNFAFGGIGKVFRAVRGVAKAGAKLVGNITRNAIKLGGGLIKGGVAVAGGVLDLARGRNPFRQGAAKKATEEVKATNQSNSYLKEIRDLLSSRLPKSKKRSAADANDDGVRDGSYEDQMRNRAGKAGPAAADRPATGGPRTGPLGKSMLGGLWDKLRGKKDGDDGIDIDLGGGDRDTRRQRRLDRQRPTWSSSQGWKAKAGFLAGKGWGAVKGIAGAGMNLVGLGGLGAGAGAVVSGIGGAIATGATALGGAALTAAGAIGSVLTAPVLLGAAAVAALAVGGYYGYKFLTKKRLGLLSRIRYAQYGFLPVDTDHTNAVFGLEDKLKDTIIYGKEGATLDAKRIDSESLFKDFDIDKDNSEAVSNWTQWFADRFKPVFLTHVTALKACAADKWLDDVDSLDPADALKYMNATRFPEGPYGSGTSPFKDLKSLPASKGDVDALIQIAEKELTKKAKPTSKGGIAGNTVTAAAAVSAAATEAKSGAGVGGISTSGVSQKVLTSVAAGAVGVEALRGGQISAVGSSVVLQSLGVDSLDGLDVVRLKTYGLVKMEADKVKALLALEKDVSDNLTFSKNVARWSGSLEKVIANNGPAFGVDVSNDEMATNWLNWFNQRFLPAYLNYATLVKAQTGKDNPAEGKPTLKASQIVDVATGVFTTSGNWGSVWNVSTSPWVDYALNADVRSTEGNMQGLKEMSKASVLAEPGSKTANQPTANKGAGNSASASEAAKPQGIFSSMWQSTKNFFSSTPSTGPTSGPPIVGAPGSGAITGGQEIVQPGKGTAGDINSIPKPTGNKSWAAMKDTILAAAKMVGVDGKLMATMASVESDFDSSVRNKDTSATGLYQFVDKTWGWMLKRHGAKYGIAPGTLATDPRANALMGAEYLKESVTTLDGKLGRPVTDTDIYFSHFLGPSGAKKFLTAAPGAVGAVVMPDAAASNGDVFYAKDRTPRTIAQIYQLMNNKLKGGAKGLEALGGGEAMVASTPQPPASGDKAKAVAVVPTSVAAPSTASAPSAFGMGANVAASLVAVSSAAPAPLTGPTNNGVPIGVQAGGFTAPRSLQDKVSAAKQQNEIRVSNLTDTNQILTDTLAVHQKSLNMLVSINSKLGEAGLTKSASNEPTPAAQTTRSAEKRATDLPRAPVSMARPPAPYG